MIDYKQLALVLAFQTPFLCFIICVYYTITLGRNGYTRMQHFLARFLGVACIIAMFFEIWSGLYINGVFPFDLGMYKIAAIGAYMSMLLNAIVWSEFCISRSGRLSHLWTFLIRVLYFVIFVLITARIAFNESKMFIYMEDGELKYGPIDDLQTYGCILIYIILMIALVTKLVDRKEFVLKEKHGKMVFANSIVLVAILVYGTIFYPYLIWMGYTLVLLYIYVGNQKSSIFNDELTHLYNRRMMIKHISDKVREEKHWSFIMIDVNSFKTINDNFGHNEGDRALETVASIINSVAKENESQAYRYAGDEFVIIHDSEDETKLQFICDEIDRRFEQNNEETKMPYLLSVSSGYAVYDENIMATIPDIMELADKRMYENKTMKKKASVASKQA